MRTLMIVNAKVNPAHSAELKEYITQSSELFAAAGGQPMHKFRIEDTLVGGEQPDLVSITAFPSRENLDELFSSPAYVALLPLRDLAFTELNVWTTTHHDD